MICELIDIDIPQLSSNGIEFANDCFEYTYSIQSSSNPSYLPSSFDATALESAIRNKSNYLQYIYLTLFLHIIAMDWFRESLNAILSFVPMNDNREEKSTLGVEVTRERAVQESFGEDTTLTIHTAHTKRLEETLEKQIDKDMEEAERLTNWCIWRGAAGKGILQFLLPH